MQVIAFDFADSDFTTPQTYREYIVEKLSGPVTSSEHNLIIFPLHTALLLAYCFGDLGDVQAMAEAVRVFTTLPQSWHSAWLTMQQNICRELNAWFVPGTILANENEKIYHEGLLLAPNGDVFGRQRQVFLSQEEKSWKIERGDDLQTFSTPFGKIGILIGTDAWYPETGRILALQDADIICYCGAMTAQEDHKNRWQQLAGIWAQVQQNQFFCVECQLSAEIAGHSFNAETLIHAPCEMTHEFTGILARTHGVGQPVTAILDNNKRHKVISSYPLLEMLQPQAYRPTYSKEGGRS